MGPMSRAKSSLVAPAQEEVERIVCASTATSRQDVFEQMMRIRASSVRHNRAPRLHAVLLYQSGWFVHWAEGPGPDLQAMIRRVARDPRHALPRVLHHSRGPRLLPNAWNMMLAPSTDSSLAFAERVHRLRQELTEHGRQHSPTSVLRRLAAPLRLPQASTWPDPEAFHRMGVCATDGAAAFGLVKWLAAHHGQSAQHRRFAAEEGLDAGLDAVDFMHEGQPCRLNALPWQGLQQGLLRVYLPDWPHLLLLFSGNARSDDALMQRVCKICSGLPAGPELLGIAPEVDTHIRMLRHAEMAGLDYLHLGLAQPHEYGLIWEAVSEELRSLGPPRSTVWPATEILQLD